ncbi:tetratricopeptide repeat protein [Flavobacteriaceae bacterium]|nr:tetratricopeptide repeat protein [Flavobacteriaceae bacterium]MDA7724069.1 tetratricopeptide repeat protein [Flavobacteriaceae bacterium]MDA7727558.1 tetratricopeptide repeat protein [Flavobacteriaceae bacterium]
MKKILIFWLMCLVGFSQTTESFKQANDLYNSGYYKEAISQYDSILASNQHSAELYFNLANCYYKLNEVGPSIFYYEKALQLAPDDLDILNNLGYAQKMTIDAIQEVPESGVSKLLNKTLNSLSVDGWAIRCVGLVFLFVVLFLGYYLSYSEAKKRLFFVSSNVVLIILFVSLGLLFKKDSLDSNTHPAIIFVKETEIKTEPNLRSETSFTLHEGTKVLVIEDYNNVWSKIKLLNGETGWMSRSELKSL